MDSLSLSGKLTSLNGRYAKTLFDIASEVDEAAQIAAQFAEFCRFVDATQELKVVLLSSALSRQDQRAVFQEIAQKFKLAERLAHFIDLLAENRRLDHLFEIQKLFQELMDAAQGLRHAQVVSAAPLTERQQKDISTILSSQFSGNLDIKYTTDPAHLGGFLVRIGNQVIDLTIANQLNQLANAMKGSAS
jgi:F-type H+-transporting ATPase subunit delta